MNKTILSNVDTRAIQLRILDFFHNVCLSNNLEYSLAYGTLLGAVRHKGFIPWDDDIDVIMPRKDYKQFCDLIHQKKIMIPEWLVLLDEDSNGYYYPILKLTDGTTIAKCEDSIVNHGVWIDVFPLDNVPKHSINQFIYILKNRIYRAIIISMTTDFNACLGKKRILKKSLNTIANIMGKGRILHSYKILMTKYSRKESEYCASLYGAYGFHEIMEWAVLKPKTYYTFENRQYKGFLHNDYYLSKLYGDYMIIPEESEQYSHNITAWKKEKMEK